MSRPLRVGVLHLGKAESGVRRYGRIIAEGAAEADGIEVVEADAGPRDAGRRGISAAARTLAGTDVVQVQWKLADWGGVRWALPHLELFLAGCRRPLVVTLHDVYEREGFRDRFLHPAAMATRRLLGRAARVIVHGEEEVRRLRTLTGRGTVTVIPHFVERLDGLPERDAAKAALGLAGRRVITLQGFMTRRKGHGIVLAALPLLPDDVVAIFAGSPIEGREARSDELATEARRLGVADRVRFTGWVPDAELRTILAASDVALAPFREMSASGSVSTWIATGRPIVTSGLPQFREYDALAPGAMRVVDPLDAEGLAARIAEILADPPPSPDPAVARLADALAIPRIVARYRAVWTEAAGR